VFESPAGIFLITAVINSIFFKFNREKD
jgi:hypothetical protein